MAKPPQGALPGRAIGTTSGAQSSSKKWPASFAIFVLLIYFGVIALALWGVVALIHWMWRHS